MVKYFDCLPLISAGEWTEIICDACGLPIVGKDYDNRHSEHEMDCPNYPLYDEDDPDDPIGCICDLEYHADCCPRCNGG